ncbi:LysR family transcriptional regulator [Fodinicurvata sediminis]|uniref:LysR family transcriptional regulator n=1 Tax=Fodinicurvata sediminis TaxID=1121832 RepID=UPI0003B4074C|nr:LysR family transcriptional regulator [Fodinicurvata sediminis]
MDSLARRLPPMNALIAFEAVVRCGTITAAARELGTSQPAVSQRLRSLETHLGSPLFQRSGRLLKPTPQAQRYCETVAQALHSIAGASEDMKPGRQARPPIVISAPFGFAHLWLEPLLPSMEVAFPERDFIIRAEDDPRVNPQRRPDMEVRFGRHERSGSALRFLFHEAAQPVCSPAFATRHGLVPDDLLAPERLRELPLLHLDEQESRWCDWPLWFQAQGIEDFEADVRLYYNNYPLLQQAALEGKGIALGWRGLVDPLLQEGRLVTCGQAFTRSGRGYGLVLHNLSSRPARQVADWIAEQAIPLADRLPQQGSEGL